MPPLSDPKKPRGLGLSELSTGSTAAVSELP